MCAKTHVCSSVVTLLCLKLEPDTYKHLLHLPHTWPCNQCSCVKNGGSITTLPMNTHPRCEQSARIQLSVTRRRNVAQGDKRYGITKCSLFLFGNLMWESESVH